MLEPVAQERSRRGAFMIQRASRYNGPAAARERQENRHRTHCRAGATAGAMLRLRRRTALPPKEATTNFGSLSAMACLVSAARSVATPVLARTFQSQPTESMYSP
jgi:hypothetical protein